MTENETEATEPASDPKPTAVRVPNVSAHARSGIDHTVLGSAADGTDNAVSAAVEPETADHPSQDDADAPDYAPAEPVQREQGETLPPAEVPGTVEHPAQDDGSTQEPVSAPETGAEVTGQPPVTQTPTEPVPAVQGTQTPTPPAPVDPSAPVDTQPGGDVHPAVTPPTS